MLTNYLGVTQDLLQNPAAPTSLYNPIALTTYINIGRGQLAGEAECIRAEATLFAVIGQRNYQFNSFNFGASAATGIQGALHVRRIAYDVAIGRKWITPRPWPWFDLFNLSNPVPVSGPPQVWAQFAQGAGSQSTGSTSGITGNPTGSFYLDPPPDQAYALMLDCVCYPIALAQDTDVEAIPYQWTDAVPYWAAWYALMSSQNQARFADAMRYKQIYDDFVARARKAANPSVGRYMYEQADDPARAAKFGQMTGKR